MTGRLPLAALLLAASACSPDAAPSPEAEKNGIRAEAPTAAPAAAKAAAEEAAPRKAAASPEGGRRRCGWLSRSVANWWLTDAEGQWILATQGADQAPGMEDMPDMSSAGWVETNGHYGYGCACMTIAADGEGRVTRVAEAQPKPLRQCEADRKLPKPE